VLIAGSMSCNLKNTRVLKITIQTCPIDAKIFR
jgi:hypothetical protein